MKRETLEPLLIDHALGQLAPEVEELVQMQIGSDSATAQLAGELDETVRLAREVMGRRMPVTVDRLPIAAMRRREMRKRVLAMAASFLLGATCALSGGRLFTPAPSPTTVVSFQPLLTYAAPTPPSPAVEQAVRKLPFWSYARIYTVASAARQDSSTHFTK